MATLYKVNIADGSALYPCDDDGLTPKEREFLKARKIQVRKGLKTLLGDVNTEDQVPLIGILGSGGGMRAAIAYGGAMNALYETGLLDVVTYAASLSGSTWYLSHLYGLEEWPKSSPRKLSEVFKKQLHPSMFKELREALTIAKALCKNRDSGQPSTLVDALGEVLADLLEPEAPHAVLSDEEKKEELCQGTVPLPLYSAIIVKPTVDAGKFHEWVEFSPYEFIMPKYGVSMDLKSFNKKQGSKDKLFEEKLCYLQGIWGSGFAILASELESSKQETARSHGPSSIKDSPAVGSSYYGGRDKQYGAVLRKALTLDKKFKLLSANDERDCGANDEWDSEANFIALSYGAEIKLLRQGLLNAAKEKQRTQLADMVQLPHLGGDQGFVGAPVPHLGCQGTAGAPVPHLGCHQETVGAPMPHLGGDQGFVGAPVPQCLDLSWVPDGIIKTVFGLIQKVWSIFKNWLGDRRDGRAAEIFSAIHGLLVKPIEGIPIPDDDQSYGVEEEEVEIIDAGIAFNLPFPPLLRRKVKLILSFEFSAREADDSNPLEVLKAAELWAKKHKIPFPEIDVTLFEKDGMKEVYVFEDEKNPDCPIILHFPLVNSQGSFSIFPHGYPTDQMLYKKPKFEQLFDLMDHNVRSNISVIKNAIRRCFNNNLTDGLSNPEGHQIRRRRRRRRGNRRRRSL